VAIHRRKTLVRNESGSARQAARRRPERSSTPQNRSRQRMRRCDAVFWRTRLLGGSESLQGGFIGLGGAWPPSGNPRNRSRRYIRTLGSPARLGLADGCKLGSGVGPKLGVETGSKLGVGAESRLGMGVESKLGPAAGLKLGSASESKLGAGVGASLRLPVGDSLAAGARSRLVASQVKLCWVLSQVASDIESRLIESRAKLGRTSNQVVSGDGSEWEGSAQSPENVDSDSAGLRRSQ